MTDLWTAPLFILQSGYLGDGSGIVDAVKWKQYSPFRAEKQAAISLSRISYIALKLAARGKVLEK
jgi:hypothetical protein